MNYQLYGRCYIKHLSWNRVSYIERWLPESQQEKPEPQQVLGHHHYLHCWVVYSSHGYQFSISFRSSESKTTFSIKAVLLHCCCSPSIYESNPWEPLNNINWGLWFRQLLQIEQWLKITIDHEEANLTKQTVVISQITQRSCNIPDGNNSFARSC